MVIERVENAINGQQVERNEIQKYINARYVFASKVVWRIFKMKLHGCFPAIQRLQVHLPNQQTVVFSEDANLQEVVGKSNLQKTTLTEWFTANKYYASIQDTPYAKFPGCGTKHQRNGHHIKEEPRSIVFTMHIQLLEKDIICGCY